MHNAAPGPSHEGGRRSRTGLLAGSEDEDRCWALFQSTSYSDRVNSCESWAPIIRPDFRALAVELAVWVQSVTPRWVGPDRAPLEDPGRGGFGRAAALHQPGESASHGCRCPSSSLSCCGRACPARPWGGLLRLATLSPRCVADRERGYEGAAPPRVPAGDGPPQPIGVVARPFDWVKTSPWLPGSSGRRSRNMVNRARSTVRRLVGVFGARNMNPRLGSWCRARRTTTRPVLKSMSSHARARASPRRRPAVPSSTHSGCIGSSSVEAKSARSSSVESATSWRFLGRGGNTRAAGFLWIRPQLTAWLRARCKVRWA